MSFQLPPLPYKTDALSPYMSPTTFEFHYGKHHQAYVTNLNKLVEGTADEGKSLEDLTLECFNRDDKVGIFNNAAQVWNHSFFWNSLHPQGGGQPTGELKDRLEHDFGSVDQFKETFKAAAISQFGSGWAWLVEDRGVLTITKTPNAVNPLCYKQKPLMTVDVWEHAYYLDYQNRRPDFVQAILDHLIHWDFIKNNLWG